MRSCDLYHTWKATHTKKTEPWIHVLNMPKKGVGSQTSKIIASLVRGFIQVHITNGSKFGRKTK